MYGVAYRRLVCNFECVKVCFNIYTQTFVMDICCCDVAVIKFCIKKGSESLIRE